MWREATMRADSIPHRPSRTSLDPVLREFDGTDVLEAAACLGESFTINDLSRAAGGFCYEVVETILRVLDRGIIRRRAATEPSSVFLDPSDSYSFVHERVAYVVRSQVALETQIDVQRPLGCACCCFPTTPAM